MASVTFLPESVVTRLWNAFVGALTGIAALPLEADAVELSEPARRRHAQVDGSPTPVTAR